MPTTRPRYTITDTGSIREMLDVAEKRWPGVDRKELLVRLSAAGRDAVERELSDSAEQRERQQQAMRRVGELVDAGVLLSDAAWR